MNIQSLHRVLELPKNPHKGGIYFLKKGRKVRVYLVDMKGKKHYIGKVPLSAFDD